MIDICLSPCQFVHKHVWQIHVGFYLNTILSLKQWFEYKQKKVAFPLDQIQTMVCKLLSKHALKLLG